MKWTRSRRILCVLTVALLASGFLLPAAAEAGVKKIWAADFKPVDSSHWTRQLYILEDPSGSVGGLDFFAKVKIPAGSVVTKVEAQMKSSAAVYPAVGVYVERARLDGSVWEEASVLQNGSSGGAWVVGATTSFENPGYVNKARDRWFVIVSINHATAALSWVKIYYQIP